MLCCGQRRLSYHVKVNLFSFKFSFEFILNLEVQSNLHGAPAGEQGFRCFEECCNRLLQKLSLAS